MGINHILTIGTAIRDHGGCSAQSLYLQVIQLFQSQKCDRHFNGTGRIEILCIIHLKTEFLEGRFIVFISVDLRINDLNMKAIGIV